jgi:hypothetical protein
VSYEPVLSERVLSMLGGFPLDGLTELSQIMARVCEDPRDPLVAVPTEDADVWRADFSEGRGFVTYFIIDSANVVRVTDIVWVG